MKAPFNPKILVLFFLVASVIIFDVRPSAGQKLSLVGNESTKIGVFEKEFVHKFLKPGEYLHESDVKEGDTGYGLSVFHGTKVERFDVKVIGVMKQVLNGRDSILVRISGDVLGKNNLVRGMSGSPIYIKDKLVGALSYGFDFSKEPIVGVTPIVDMLDAIIKPGDERTLRTSSRKLEMSSIWGNSIEASKLRQSIMSSGAPKLVPLMTPVSMSGFSSRAQNFLKTKFKPFGLEFAQGSSGGVNNYLLKKVGWKANILKPGSAVSLLLSTGDFTSAGTGTVTGIFDKRVLAFGHPLMEAGAIDIPMSSAYIHEILPSLSVSFKLSSPLKILGRIFADRPWSVGGELGKYASMIPVDVLVIDGQRKYKRKFHCEVVNHPDFTSNMVSAVVMSAMDATFQSSDPYLVKVRSQVKVKDGISIDRVDQHASFARTGGISFLGMQFFSDPVVSYLDSVISEIYDNKYKKAEVERVNVVVEFEVGKAATKIERVVVENPVVEPGDTVNLKCVLKPFDKKQIIESFQIKVPRDAPDGNFMVGVSGGARYKTLRKSMKMFQAKPESFDEMLANITDKPSSDKLVALLALPKQAVHIDGKVIQSPPGHWSKLFFSNRYTNGPSVVVGEKRYEKKSNGFITGSHVVGFQVKRKKPFESAQKWYLSQSASGKYSSGTHITSQARKVIDSIGRVSDKKSSSSSSSTSTSSSSSNSKTSSSTSNFASNVSGLHTRSVRLWNQFTDNSFKGGELKNSTIDSWGRIFPGFEKSIIHSIDSDIRAWSSTMSGGKFYFATSNEIFSWDGSSKKPSSVAKVSAALVPSLAADSKGNVYAACVPSGKIVVINSNGVKDFFKTKEKVITQIAVDAQDNLYVGVAGSGLIYKVSESGGLISTIDTGQAHITCLTYSANLNRILVGTGETGNVYSLSQQGVLNPEYQTGEHIVTGAAFDKRGNLFVATAGKGTLLKVDKTGKVNSLATSEAFYHLKYDSNTDSIFTGDAEGDITQIQIEPLPNRSFFVPVNHTNQEAVVSLEIDDQSNLYVLTSNLPTVQLIHNKPRSESYYISSVKDAQRKSKWSTLRVHGAYNQFEPKVLENLKVESRTGFTLKPDKTWSDFAQCPRFEDGFKIDSPEGRYFQYKITWDLKKLNAPSSEDNDKTFPLRHDSSVGRVMTTFLPENNAPVVRTFNLTSGAFVSGKKDLKLNSSDPDGDNLVLSIDISSDNGKTWKLLKDNIVGKSKSSEDNKKKSKSSKKGSKPSTRVKWSKGKFSPKKKVDDSTKDNDEESKSEKKDSEKDNGKDEKKKESDKKIKPEKSSWNRLYSRKLVTFLQAAKFGASGKDGEGKHIELDSKDKESKDKSSKSKDKKKDSSGKDKKKKSKEKSKRKKGDSMSSSSKSTAGPIEWTWDTKKQNDGVYILRFKLSDSLSNGGTGLTNQFYRTVVIDNKAPSISDVNQVWSGKTLKSLSMKVKDKISPIVNATFEADTKESFAFVPQTGLLDRKEAVLSVADIKFAKSPKKLKLVVTDKAGNEAKKDIKVKK